MSQGRSIRLFLVDGSGQTYAAWQDQQLNAACPVTEKP